MSYFANDGESVYSVKDAKYKKKNKKIKLLILSDLSVRFIVSVFLQKLSQSTMESHVTGRSTIRKNFERWKLTNQMLLRSSKLIMNF